MKKHKVLYKHLGQNSITAYTPIRPYENSPLDEKVWRFIQADWDQRELIHECIVLDVTLPPWLPLNEWIENHITWHWFWHVYKMPVDLKEDWARKLVYSRDEKELLAIAKLFGNIRSKFKISLKNQLVAWLDDPDPPYPNPLSPKQISALLRGADLRESTRAYYWCQTNEVKGIYK